MKLLFLIIFLQSCLQVTPTYRNTISEDKFVNSFQQCQDGVLAKTAIVVKIQKLFANSDTLYKGLSVKNQIKVEQVTVKVIEQDLTPLQPLILNSNFFTQKYQSLKQMVEKLPSDMQDYLFDGIKAPLDELSDEQAEYLGHTLKTVRIINSLAGRWMQMHCDKSQLEESATDDVRKNPDYLADVYGELLNENSFFDYFYMTFGEDLFKQYFSMKVIDKKRKFSCQLSADFGTSIVIPLNTTEHFEEIKEAIEKHWALLGKVRVVIQKSVSRSSSVVSVSMKNNMISHSLKIGSNEIFLNPKLFDNFSDGSQKIIAHEFGHVLGFPDCYLEFFDQSDNLVNYSLNPKDLMCSLEGMIPEHYFLQIQNNLCH